MYAQMDEPERQLHDGANTPAARRESTSQTVFMAGLVALCLGVALALWTSLAPLGVLLLIASHVIHRTAVRKV